MPSIGTARAGAGLSVIHSRNNPSALLASRMGAEGEGISLHSQWRSSGTSLPSLHGCWSLPVKKMEYVVPAGVTKSGKIISEALLLCQGETCSSLGSPKLFVSVTQAVSEQEVLRSSA